MRIAFLTHEPFYPPSGGGSAEANYLVQELAGRGHLVHVFAPQIPDQSEVQRRFKARYHPFTAWSMGRYTSLRNLKYVLYPFFLERLVLYEARSSRFDLIVSQHSISAVTAGRLKSALKVPVVMNFLDYLMAFMETWPGYIAPKLVVRRLKEFELSLPQRYQADAILTVSDVLADYFVERGYRRDRILPIYFGYDDQIFVRDAAAAEPPNPPVVVMHGSLDRHHLGPIALEALAHVVEHRPEVRFRFVGHPTAALKSFVQKARQRAPRAKIECTGFVPYARVAEQLSTATVGIVPYEESAGVHCAFVAKAVEYLAMGLPVVSTSVQGLMRYFAEEPLIQFAGFDGPSFGRKILDWIECPGEKRRQQGEAASRRVQRELNWGCICRRAADFMEMVCCR
jgi:glycosyltransferase involved in cell wall biosynthesis